MTNTERDAETQVEHLGFQPHVGFGRHNGGFAATYDLLALCHIGEGKEVLDAGCCKVRESVMALVQDSRRAIDECVRVRTYLAVHGRS